MPLFKWDELEETLITPSRTQSRGKTIRGKYLTFQRIMHREDRGDGHAGARTHSHPEEQIFIALKGTMKIRAGDTWYTMESSCPPIWSMRKSARGISSGLTLKTGFLAIAGTMGVGSLVRKMSGRRPRRYWTKWIRSTRRKPRGMNDHGLPELLKGGWLLRETPRIQYYAKGV